MGVDGQRHAPAALPPGKARYALYRTLGGPQGRSGQVRKLTITWIRSPDRPGRSESQYRLRYPGPLEKSVTVHKSKLQHPRRPESPATAPSEPEASHKVTVIYFQTQTPKTNAWLRIVIVYALKEIQAKKQPRS